MDQGLAELAHEIEAALTLSDSMTERARSALAEASGKPLPGVDFDSTDSVLELVHDLQPGWHVSMRGTARLPNGHWSCTLRQSTVRDNDAYIGAGSGPTLPHALLAALLKALAQSR